MSNKFDCIFFDISSPAKALFFTLSCPSNSSFVVKSCSLSFFLGFLIFVFSFGIFYFLCPVGRFLWRIFRRFSYTLPSGFLFEFYHGWEGRGLMFVLLLVVCKIRFALQVW